MNDIFNTDNTQGYSENEIQILNDRWIEYCKKNKIKPDTSEYEQEKKWFFDKIAKE